MGRRRTQPQRSQPILTLNRSLFGLGLVVILAISAIFVRTATLRAGYAAVEGETHCDRLELEIRLLEAELRALLQPERLIERARTFDIPVDEDSE